MQLFSCVAYWMRISWQLFVLQAIPVVCVEAAVLFVSHVVVFCVISFKFCMSSDCLCVIVRRRCSNAVKEISGISLIPNVLVAVSKGMQAVKSLLQVTKSRRHYSLQVMKKQTKPSNLH